MTELSINSLRCEKVFSGGHYDKTYVEILIDGDKYR